MGSLKRKILICISSIFALLHYGCAQQPKANIRYSELTEWGLKGNVKTETLLVFEGMGVSDEKLLSVDTSQWMRRVVVHYNREGNCEKLENFDNVAEGYDTVITNYKYDGNERTGVATSKGKTTQTTTKVFPTRQSYKESAFDSAGRLIMETTAKLDGNFRVISMEEKYYDDENKAAPTSDNIVEYSFDADDRLVKIASKDKLTGKRYIVLQVLNREYDSRGNAIKTLKKSLSTSSKKRLILGLYEYYQ